MALSPNSCKNANVKQEKNIKMWLIKRTVVELSLSSLPSRIEHLAKTSKAIEKKKRNHIINKAVFNSHARDFGSGTGNLFSLGKFYIQILFCSLNFALHLLSYF